MDGWIKKTIYAFFIIIAPSILIYLVCYILPDPESTRLRDIFSYAVTLVGLIVFYRSRPCSIWVLPLAFALPVLICYVKDTLNDSEWLTYLYTILVTIYYSLPFILLTTVIASVCTIRRNKGKHRHPGPRRLTLQEVRGWAERKKGSLLSAGVLTLVFLFIALLSFVSISRRNMVRRDIIQRIDTLTEEGGKCVFKLSDVTRFKWDKVVYFEYPVSSADISRAAGIDYTGGTDLLEGFIFIYRGRVVWKDVVGIAPGAREKARLGVKCGRLTVLKEEDAVFEGWEERDMFYLIQPVVE